MLYIITNLELLNGAEYMYDVEACFGEYKDKVKKQKLYGRIIRSIDNVSEYKDEFIRTPFGCTSIDNLSSGAKAMLLAVTFPNVWVNFLEAGENVFNLALEIANDIDLHILCERTMLFTKHTDTELIVNGYKYKAKDLLGRRFK